MCVSLTGLLFHIEGRKVKLAAEPKSAGTRCLSPLGLQRQVALRCGQLWAVAPSRSLFLHRRWPMGVQPGRQCPDQGPRGVERH